LEERREGKEVGEGLGRGELKWFEGGTRIYANGRDSGSEREAAIGMYGLREKREGSGRSHNTGNNGAEVE